MDSSDSMDIDLPDPNSGVSSNMISDSDDNNNKFFSEMHGHFPPINILPCTTSSITFGPQRRKTIIVPQNPTMNYYLIVGREIHTGKSPVHVANVADGASPARSTIRPNEHAVKVYPPHVLRNRGASSAEDPYKEVQVLQFLQNRHANILTIHGCYSDFHSGEMFLDMPCYPRGDALDLMDHFKARDRVNYLPMALAKTAIYSLLSALEHLHGLGITHHDISPEQLLYDETLNRFVLIDFGMCIRQGRDNNSGMFLPYPLPHFCGKAGYWAPEIEAGSEVPSPNPSKRDMWSIGPTMVMILTGEKLRDIARARRLENLQYFQGVSQHMVALLYARYEQGRGEDFRLAIDLMSKLMKYLPEDRITATEALRHPWFTEG